MKKSTYINQKIFNFLLITYNLNSFNFYEKEIVWRYKSFLEIEQGLVHI